MHMMSDESSRQCPECNTILVKQIGTGYLASKGFNPTLAENRESNYKKKTSDPERANKENSKK